MPSSPGYKRDYDQEYATQKKRGEHPSRMERQRARREADAKGVDRSGKDLAHRKPLSKGGLNKDGVTLQPPSKNRSFPRTKTGAMK